MQNVGRVSKRLLKVPAVFASLSLNQCSLSECMSALMEYREVASVKFDESVDISFQLGVDPKKSDQIVRGSCTLPHGNGKTVKVLVFTSGSSVDKAISSGATIAGSDDIITDILNGKIVPERDFTSCISTPDMMPKLSKIAKILGPRGMMPNVKLGTVVSNIESTIKDMISGRVEFRSDKSAFIKLSIGRLSFSSEQIADNLRAIYCAIKSMKPASIKSNYFVSLRLSTTMMGSSFHISMSELYSIS